MGESGKKRAIFRQRKQKAQIPEENNTIENSRARITVLPKHSTSSNEIHRK